MSLPISFKVTSLALEQLYGCPSTRENNPQDYGCGNHTNHKQCMMIRWQLNQTVCTYWVMAPYSCIPDNKSCIELMYIWVSTIDNKALSQQINHTNYIIINSPDTKVHGPKMGPIWGWQDPDGPHVGPLNFVIWVTTSQCVTSQLMQKNIKSV